MGQKFLEQMNKVDGMKEICANCGCTFGSHHGGMHSWPQGKCPGHEGRMDWDQGPDTTFEPSGDYVRS